MPFFPQARRRTTGPRATSAAEAAGGSLRLSFTDPAEEARRRILIFALGVPDTDLGRIADLAVRGLDPDKDRPVLVVSTLDFARLRERGLPFEYLPTRESLAPVDAEAHAAYLRRRLAVIRLKWEPDAEVVVGRPVEAFLAEGA